MSCATENACPTIVSLSRQCYVGPNSDCCAGGASAVMELTEHLRAKDCEAFSELLRKRKVRGQGWEREGWVRGLAASGRIRLSLGAGSSWCIPGQI